MYYTYVLRCSDGKFYIGSSSNLKQRFREHQSGYVDATINRRPLVLVYYEASLSKKSALDRERYFKTGFGREFLRKRIGKTPT